MQACRPVRTIAVVLLGMATGCASRSGPAPDAQPLTGRTEWVSTLYRQHPLVGRIWDVRKRDWIDEAALEAALPRAGFVLLGETHDNPDHHLLQARMVRAIVSAGRRPALAFEMLDVDQQRAVDAALAHAPRTADAVAEAVDWAHGGWPDFSLYRPVFAAGIDAGLPLVAANLPHADVERLVSHGPSALPAGLRAILDREGPLPDEVARAMRDEMRRSHCGALPDSALGPMVLVQRARDAQIAERLLSADHGQGGVLITGAGHAREDRGVPVHLSREAPAAKVIAVAFLEVSPDARAPEAYAAGFGTRALPFDYVVFTPAAEREDPCEGLRNRKIRPTLPRPPSIADGGVCIRPGRPAQRACTAVDHAERGHSS